VINSSYSISRNIYKYNLTKKKLFEMNGDGKLQMAAPFEKKASH
jgi:hypothetical protein